MKRSINRVYVDSSVFGGLFDREFAADSRTFFEQVQAGRFKLLSSFLVSDELERAPDAVREFFDSMLSTTELVRVSQEAITLQEAYLSAGIVTSKSAADGLHVALATVAGADLIVSWNFRHIVHFQKVPRYNAVNRLYGWPELAIHSPKEVLVYEDEDI